jgi:hypothetical protein
MDGAHPPRFIVAFTGPHEKLPLRRITVEIGGAIEEATGGEVVPLEWAFAAQSGVSWLVLTRPTVSPDVERLRAAVVARRLPLLVALQKRGFEWVDDVFAQPEPIRAQYLLHADGTAEEVTEAEPLLTPGGTAPAGAFSLAGVIAEHGGAPSVEAIFGEGESLAVDYRRERIDNLSVDTCLKELPARVCTSETRARVAQCVRSLFGEEFGRSRFEDWSGVEFPRPSGALPSAHAALTELRALVQAAYPRAEFTYAPFASPESWRVTDFASEFVPDIPSEPVVVVRSPMGSGKTTAIVRLLEGGTAPRRVLWLSPRRTLTRALGAKLADLGFREYLDISAGKIPATVDRLIISPESLGRLESACKWDLVVVDESETIARSLGGKTCADSHRRSAGTSPFEAFARLGAYRAIIADADVGEATAVLVGQVWGAAAPLLLNSTRRAYSKNVAVFTGKGKAAVKAFLRRIECLLLDGKRIFVNCFSAETVCRKVVPMLRRLGVSYGVIIGSDAYKKYSDEAAEWRKEDQARQQELVRNVALWAEHRVIIATPALTCGVDFAEPGVFDCRVGYFTHFSASARDATQAWLRVRHTNDDSDFVFINADPDARRATRIDMVALNRQIAKAFGTAAAPPGWLLALYEICNKDGAETSLQFAEALTGRLAHMTSGRITTTTIEDEDAPTKKPAPRTASALPAFEEVPDMTFEEFTKCLKAEMRTEAQELAIRKMHCKVFASKLVRELLDAAREEFEKLPLAQAVWEAGDPLELNRRFRTVRHWRRRRAHDPADPTLVIDNVTLARRMIEGIGKAAGVDDWSRVYEDGLEFSQGALASAYEFFDAPSRSEIIKAVWPGMARRQGEKRRASYFLKGLLKAVGVDVTVQRQRRDVGRSKVVSGYTVAAPLAKSEPEELLMRLLRAMMKAD